MHVKHQLSVARSCDCVSLPRSLYYREHNDRVRRDHEVARALAGVIATHPRWGFWKCCQHFKRQGHGWNPKRVYRVYCAMRLNQPRPVKRRLPQRVAQPLTVPHRPNQTWSADFMSDALHHGSRFRTLNVIDDFNRQALAIEIDTSLRAPRLIRLFERLKEQVGLPATLRVDNGPEFLSSDFATWCKKHRLHIQYIQPGKPNQNAYIERFNRTCRNEVLDLHLFRNLEQVREITSRWVVSYNEQRPHDALGGVPPCAYTNQHAENSTLQLS